MSLAGIVILHGLVGVSCGLLFRMQILIPLVAVTLFEVAILKASGLWPSPFWSAFVLLVLLETGYLIGASVGTLWPSSVRRETLQSLIARMTLGDGRMPTLDDTSVTRTF